MQQRGRVDVVPDPAHPATVLTNDHRRDKAANRGGYNFSAEASRVAESEASMAVRISNTYQRVVPFGHFPGREGSGLGQRHLHRTRLDADDLSHEQSSLVGGFDGWWRRVREGMP